MTFQNLIITNPSKLSFANNCLVVSQGMVEDVSVPLTNINIVLLDNPQITVSSVLMRECVQNNVVIICCDDKHMPSGIMHGYNTHFQASRMLEMQIALSVPLKKQLWRAIVSSKILSQASNLLTVGSKKHSQLVNLGKEVKSGDTGNMEAIAAKIYFAEMFENFRRFDNDKTNIMLNYGYSLLRSTIAKYLVMSGLNPALGIFHHSQFNNFNLADDIIEIFRHIVDKKVYEYKGKEEEFTKHDKIFLFEIFKERVQFEDGSFILIDAIEKVVQSLQKTIKSKDISDFTLPKIEVHIIDMPAKK